MNTPPVIPSTPEEVIHSPAMVGLIERFKMAQACGGIIPITGRADAGGDKLLRLFLADGAVAGRSVEVCEDPEIRAGRMRPMFNQILRTSLFMRFNQNAGLAPNSVARFLYEYEVSAVGIFVADQWKEQSFRFLAELDEAVGLLQPAGESRPVLLFTAQSDWAKHLHRGQLPHSAFFADVVPDAVDHQRLIDEFTKHDSLKELAVQMAAELKAEEAVRPKVKGKLVVSCGPKFSAHILKHTGNEIAVVHRLIKLALTRIGTMQDGQKCEARMAIDQTLPHLSSMLPRTPVSSSSSAARSPRPASNGSVDVHDRTINSNRPAGRRGE
jgi:hypothetical protein